MNFPVDGDDAILEQLKCNLEYIEPSSLHLHLDSIKLIIYLLFLKRLSFEHYQTIVLFSNFTILLITVNISACSYYIYSLFLPCTFMEY